MFNLNFIVMPRNKVLEKAKVSMPSGRNAFDLSQERSFQSLAGEIDIAYCQPFVAGTKGSINRESFTRTSQVVAPAFHRVTEHFDFFVVPIHSLWRPWENWKLNINDMQDTNLVDWNSSTGTPDLGLSAHVPQMNFKNLVNLLGYGTTSSPSSIDVANDNARLANNVVRLCDWLRYGCDVITQNTRNVVQNLFKICAYQKCYFDHYRNSAYESNNPYAYNLDWLSHGGHQDVLSPGSSTQETAVAREMFKIRNVNYRNDYFHNIYPALNYVQSSPVGSWVLPSNIGGVSAGATNQYNQPSTASTAQTNQLSPHAITGTLNTNTLSIGVQQIRALFAIDKLMRASAYAPKHVREQYKALYGVDGVEDFDMKSERIGSFQNVVTFEEVTNMAGTSSNSLGELGAKGKGGSNKEKPINFYCKYDSIVIGLHYFLPRARYDSYGIHPWNSKLVRQSFYVKAFENLGLRPFLTTEFEGSAAPNMIAWTVPNYEYKILPDLNFGAFRLEFESFRGDNTGGTNSVKLDSGLSSELQCYVPHTLSPVGVATSVGSANASYFKVMPEDLDNIFKVAVPAYHPISYCQFFGEFRISVPVVAPMSVHGQPSL